MGPETITSNLLKPIAQSQGEKLGHSVNKIVSYYNQGNINSLASTLPKAKYTW
jgi:hypothetical protein